MSNDSNKPGIKHDKAKPPMHLIPAEASIYEALVWAKGAEEYGMYNWRQGLAVSRIINALERHIAAIKLGQDIDPFSKLPHAAHIRCDAAMLITMLSNPQLDDRYKGYSEDQVKQYLEAMGYYK